MSKPGPQDIELWCNGVMVGHGAAALAPLPDTPAQREACANMVRVEARAVEAQERRDAAEHRRDAALQQQEVAQSMVDQARASLISQLCERADDLGRRLDKFERARAREYLDSLPDPEDPNQGGELSLVGPARNPAADQTLPQVSPPAI
jgi:hypothetical protein